jgi:hypothetical protein
MGSQSDTQRSQLRRASAAACLTEVRRRPFVGGADPRHHHHAAGVIEVFLEDNKLYYRPMDSQETESVLLYEN